MKKTKTIRADSTMLEVLNNIYGTNASKASITMLIKNKDTGHRVTTIVDRRRKQRVNSII